MSAIRTISSQTARRLAISKQHLSAQPAPAMLDLIRDLGCLQLDPISKVARTHLLVLWSRLQKYDVAELENLRWRDRALFEYWAHAASIVLTEDYPIHAVVMRHAAESERTQAFINDNELHQLREHILDRIRAEGALGTNDFEHEQRTNETFSGWTNGRAVNRLMERLWTMGDLMVSERKGMARRWELTERFFPEWTPREEITPYEASYRAMQRAVKALGVARGKPEVNYHFTRHHYWEYATVLKKLLADGKLQQIAVDGIAGDWLIHSDDVPLLDRIEAGDWAGRTTLLSPFDNLICDRARTERLWDFYFRIEIYVPQNKRQYGYYVLPILHQDRLVGRMDMAFEKQEKCLHVISTYAEDNAPDNIVPEIREAVGSLGKFLGAKSIRFGETMPKIWKKLK